MMISLISLVLFVAAMVAVIAVMAATLVPAMPRIVAILTTDTSHGAGSTQAVYRPDPRRMRPVMANARPATMAQRAAA